MPTEYELSGRLADNSIVTESQLDGSYKIKVNPTITAEIANHESRIDALEAAPGSGDVSGPGSSTDNAVARFDGTDGVALQNSLVTISDAGSISLPSGQTVDGVDVGAVSPTAGEKAALVGTSGTPGSGNKYVTDADPRIGGAGSLAIAKAGSLVGTRPTLNLIEGSGATLTVTDNSGSNRVDVTVAASGGGSFSVASDIAPLHWYLATQVSSSGGLVDSLNDQGSSVKNFTQTSTPRAPVGTDSDGDIYLALDGSADFYQAGAVADWVFLHNNSDMTIAIVYASPTVVSSDMYLLNTNDGSSGNTGFSLYQQAVGGSPGGPGYFQSHGVGGESSLAVQDIKTAPTATKMCLIVRVSYTNNQGGAKPGGDATPQPIDATLRRFGKLRSMGARTGHPATGSNPTYNLTLGKRANASAGFSNNRIYEIVIDNKAWSDRQVLGYEEYARTTYHLPGV